MRGDATAAIALPLVPADLFWAIGSLCNLHRLPFDAALLARAYPPPHTLGTLIEALRAIGCVAELAARRADQLASLPMPCIVVIASPAGVADALTEVRPALVVRADAERVLYFAAGANTPTVAAADEFGADYLGIALKVARQAPPPAEGDIATPQRFGFRWFVPELLRHRAVWREVLAASLAIQLLALAMPLLSQVIIDKVIVHRATSTPSGDRPAF